ncbi:MAG: glycosyltransferase family 4 protein [Chloroflexi bacterium]|nr:glycosyltransferase family 4 protein [Chloroflexota bacterium]
MNILHVIQRYWPYTGGSERHLQEIAERQAAEGHHITVYTTDAWDIEAFWAPGKALVETPREQHNGVEIVRFPVRRLPFPRLVFPAWRRMLSTLSDLPIDTTPLLAQLCRFTPWSPMLEQALNEHPGPLDVVHGWNICFEAFLHPAYRLARRVGAAFVLTPLIHLGEPGDRRVRRYYTMRHQLALARKSDAILAQTESETKYLVEHGVVPERVARVGVGVSPAQVLGGVGQRFRECYGVDGPIVAFLGTLAYDKGAHHTVKAMEQLWKAGSEATLVMAGPTMDQFSSFFERLPDAARQRCRVLGFIPEEEKRDLLDAMDVLVMPSRTDSLGLVYLEAWLYGKPVIGAWAGGVPDVITNARDGFLVPFGDVGQLAEQIVCLLRDRSLAQTFGKAGRRKVLSSYTWAHLYPKIREVYEGLWRTKGERAAVSISSGS